MEYQLPPAHSKNWHKLLKDTDPVLYHEASSSAMQATSMGQSLHPPQHLLVEEGLAFFQQHAALNKIELSMSCITHFLQGWVIDTGCLASGAEIFIFLGFALAKWLLFLEICYHSTGDIIAVCAEPLVLFLFFSFRSQHVFALCSLQVAVPIGPALLMR